MVRLSRATYARISRRRGLIERRPDEIVLLTLDGHPLTLDGDYLTLNLSQQ